MKRRFLDSCGVLAIATAVSGASASVVYDTTYGGNGQPGTATSIAALLDPNASCGDDLTLDPELDVPDRVIRRMNFAYIVPGGVTVPDCDALVTFYDSEDEGAEGDTLALSDPVGGVRVHIGAFTAVPQFRTFTSGFVDVTGGIAGGVALPDGVGGVSIRFVQAGTDTILTGTTITPGLSTGNVGVGSNAITYFYVDGLDGVPLDAEYTGAERFGLSGELANSGKIWMQLDNVPEPASLVLLLVGAAVVTRRR